MLAHLAISPYRTRHPSPTPTSNPRKTPGMPRPQHQPRTQFTTLSKDTSWKLSHQSFDNSWMKTIHFQNQNPNRYKHPAPKAHGTPTPRSKMIPNGSKRATNSLTNMKTKICSINPSQNQQMQMPGHSYGHISRNQIEKRRDAW